MNLSERVDELVSQGLSVGEAIARAITEKSASVMLTERIAHGGH
jgi:uncharacterized protein YoaH (UPF0181 family)